MIASLRGVLAAREPAGQAVVEVGGVGYRVTVTPSTLAALGDPGAEVFLHIHHHMREDHQALYGFLSADERACFEALLAAHGVGPALALAILSVHPPAALRRVLAEEDVAALCRVPGVGRKTAARLLVELRERVGDTVPGGPTDPEGVSAGVLGDVREALASLGYGPEEIAEVTAGLPPEGDPSELLRTALRSLAR